MSQLARRIAKATELVAAFTKRQIRGATLTLPSCPPWATPLPDGRSVYLIGGEAEHRAAVLEALATHAALPPDTLVRPYKPGTSKVIAEMQGGPDTADALELAAWSSRGDWKTTAVLEGFTILGDRHRLAGLPGPYRVIAATGSHVEHKLKLCRTMLAPHWGTGWVLTDDEHVATLTIDGRVLVVLDLFGVNDPGALGRLRMESHALWIDEGAPAAAEGSSGVDETAWAMGITSLRLPAARHVAVFSSNYPDDDFWAWQRFEARPAPGTVSVRITPGENASAADREQWRVALASRPDLLARLVDGEPAIVQQGPQVAVGYRDDVHVAEATIPIDPSLEFWCAWDSMEVGRHHACIIAQQNGRVRNILAGLSGEHMPFVRFLEQVIAWFQRHAPWVLRPGGSDWLFHRGDVNMETEGAEAGLSPCARITKALGGPWAPGAVDWPGRIDPLLTLIGETDGRGGAALQISPDPDTLLLRKTLGGRAYYGTSKSGTVVRDTPFKPNHPWEDLLDAMCYLAGALAPDLVRHRRQNAGPRAKTNGGVLSLNEMWVMGRRP